MELSNEDALRLNVLLNQDLQAIRIDESKMIVYGLSDKGEAAISLNPNCRDEQYLKQVKELISTQVLGSPGGYPVFLRRWTRMGQTRDKSLDKLLQLGESEAVVAVVHAEGLTDDLARRAWWAMPCSENARCMLRREAVVQGEMGPVLADFLLEFLPFEEEPRDIVESVRLVLQPGLIDEATRADLWSKGQRKNAYLVGFLKTLPDALPEPARPHPQLSALQDVLKPLIDEGNPFARQLLRTLDVPGQAFLKTATQVMKKPANQDVVVALLEAIEDYFADMHPGCEPCREVDTILEAARHCCEEPQQLPAPAREVIEQLAESRELAESALVLAQMGVPVINPIFAATDSVGSVMRRKIEPVSIPFLNMPVDYWASRELMGLKFSRVAVSLVVKVPLEVLEQHMVANPAVVGEELAREVAGYARQHDLGYYPALDYFLEHGGVEPDLLNAVESMTWLVTGLVREEIKTRLRPVFSNIRFESIQALAYTMPTVRPGQNNALLRLGEHFTPDQVKLTLIATAIRHRDTPETAVKMAERMIWRWLHEHFEAIDITSIRYLPPEEDDTQV